MRFPVRFIFAIILSVNFAACSKHGAGLIPMFVRHISIMLGLGILLGCGKSAPTHSIVVERPLLPASQSKPVFKTYPIDDAFSGGGPALTRLQRDWLRRVVRSRAYGGLRSHLRFARIRGFRAPIVVFVDRARPGEIDRGGRVLGDPCNVWFDPFLRGLILGTGALCSGPSAAPVN